jgi:putative mRNA 3-end processing factor
VKTKSKQNCKMPLISFTENGLYCAAGNFYIDPWKPVNKAIITHAHSDHARTGANHYLCHQQCKPLLQLRLGDNNYQALAWGEEILMDGVTVSLHPAGHIIGSSQVRVSYKGEVWVFSGDYKTASDGISGDFEPVPCHNFITESTFGLPIYQWKKQAQIYEEIRRFAAQNQGDGINSVFLAYSLGKAQRMIDCLWPVAQKIYAHGAVANTQDTLIQNGLPLPPVIRITPDTPKKELQGAIIIAPPSAEGSPWMKKLQPYRLAICSGWMQVRGNARRRNADMGFAVSDHADFAGLVTAVKATGAATVYVTHGFQSSFSRYLNEAGTSSYEVKTAYGNDEETEPEIEVL